MARYTARIRQYEIEDTDELYRLELSTYNSEDGAQIELTADYFGPGGLDTARTVAAAWETGGQFVRLILACVPLHEFSGRFEPRFIGDVPVYIRKGVQS
jgi:hypothetical protein